MADDAPAPFGKADLIRHFEDEIILAQARAITARQRAPRLQQAAEAQADTTITFAEQAIEFLRSLP